uniref:Uncharacterized protein n=1 Tax=Timema genevievae TaxID=629358 RepID=A0A7R9JRE3_TIMGE|nr:unnamed protein product [Timema genevievae]
MEVTPTGGAIREHSSSVESSSSEEKKVIGGRHVIEKSSSFQAEESSKVVESSQSVQQSSSRLVQSSVSSVSSSQKTVSSSSTSLSSDLQSQLLICPHEAEFDSIPDPLLHRYVLEAPGIEPRTSGYVDRNSEDQREFLTTDPEVEGSNPRRLRNLIVKQMVWKGLKLSPGRKIEKLFE